MTLDCPYCYGVVHLWIDVALEEPYALCGPCNTMWDQDGREVKA